MDEKTRAMTSEESVLVVGLGEIGRPLYDIFSESKRFNVYGYDIDQSKSIDKYDELPKPVDFLHIAIPFSDKFIDIAINYAEEFRPRLIFIHSTIAPGTIRKINDEIKIPIAYTPVRGKHPKIRRHLLFWTKWVTVLPLSQLEGAVEHLRNVGFKVRPYMGSPESLELAKLWETIYRAVMIASWQEIHRIARRFGADIEAIAEFVGEVHEVLRDRPVYYPDYIGGHCLIPNTEILRSVFPSKLFDFIIESNKKRKEEIRQKDVCEEIKKVKNVALRLTNVEYYEVLD